MNVHSQSDCNCPTDLRVPEILRAIRHIFIEKGFDGASMQDLARGSGMSAGNFYRYFRSKNAIIEAMVAHDLGEFRDDFARIMSADDPMAELRTTIARHLTAQDQGALWAEINAAALRKPEIAALCTGMEAWITDRLIEIFAHVAHLSEDAARARFTAHAGVVVMSVKATAISRAAATRADVDALMLRMIEGLLDEVSHHAD